MPHDPTRPLAPKPAPRPEDRTGQTVGRYVLTRRIGQGGGGQVFAAFDTVLDRNIALKQLWDHGGSTQDVVREGRLLARLSHPSVVTIHDIAFGKKDEVFLAMELVDGEDFATWAASQRPDNIRAMLRVLVGAGEGIAAAHQNDIVHGDVKPSNILVDTEGRARVTDFGVARIVDSNIGRLSADSDDDHTTTNPLAAGTPAYMAPEQHGGQAADPSSDQYSFCLTAWEALTGEYPFEIDNDERDLAATFSGGQEATGPLSHPLERLAQQKRSWRVPASSKAVPARWLRALRRGLDPSPSKRFESMEALLHAVRPPRRRRPALLLGGIAVGGLAVVGWTWALQLGERCTGAATALGPAWNMSTRGDLEASILATGVEFAPATWKSVSTDIDAFASQWIDSHTDACEATNVREEQSAAVMDQRMACLQRARSDLAAITRVLGELDGPSLQRAHRVVAGLPALERCRDLAALAEERSAPAADVADGVAAVREAIARSKALRGAGKVPDARLVIDDAAADAERIGFEPALVEVLVERAIVEEKSGEYTAAKTTFANAVKLAAKIGMWERALRAQRGLLYVAASRLHDAGEATAYLHIVEGLVEREGNKTVDLAELAGDRALLAFEKAEYKTAVAFYRESAALFEEALGEQALSSVYARAKVAGTLRNMGKYDEAEQAFAELIERKGSWLGTDHPETLLTRCDHAQVLYRLGRYADAETELRAALPPQEAILGRSHPEMLMYRATLAEVLSALDRDDEAEKEYRDALRNMGTGPGPAAELRNGLGNLLERAGRLEEAEEQHRKASESFIAMLGPDHPNVAISKHNLANILARRGLYDEAEEENRAAIAALEKSLGADHPQVGLFHLNFGRMFKNQSKWDAARTEIEAGVAILEKALGADHPQTAEAHELLKRLGEDEAGG